MCAGLRGVQLFVKGGGLAAVAKVRALGVAAGRVTVGLRDVYVHSSPSYTKNCASGESPAIDICLFEESPIFWCGAAARQSAHRRYRRRPRRLVTQLAGFLSINKVAVMDDHIGID